MYMLYVRVCYRYPYWQQARDSDRVLSYGRKYTLSLPNRKYMYLHRA